MSKHRENYVIKHIFEVRPFTKVFSFMDYKGEIADLFVKEFGPESLVGINNNRTQVTTKDSGIGIYFSSESMGFQIEASNSFKDFEERIAAFLDTVESFGKYSPFPLSRLGTRSNILYQIKINEHRIF